MLFPVLVFCALMFALLPTLLFLWNLTLYNPPPVPGKVEPVSVLIPARNEERSIEACVRAALASERVDLEVLVLDDHSEDRTAEIVRQIARTDSRLQLFSAPPLPVGWCGKQFACSVLAQLASKPVLCFLDADVQLAPAGLARLITAMRGQGSSLISGFRLITMTATPVSRINRYEKSCSQVPAPVFSQMIIANPHITISIQMPAMMAPSRSNLEVATHASVMSQ